jgi:hypothetical protein
MVTYVLSAFAGGIILALGISVMLHLLGRNRPLTPEQETAERFRVQARERARRTLDRMPPLPR